jgi:hypothetical protein
MTNIANIVEGCDSYSDESWAILLKKLIPEMAPSPRLTHTTPAVRFLATVRIQNDTTSNAGIEKWGFSELLRRLSALTEQKILRVEEFDVQELAVRCVFCSDSSTLLGCTIVKKRQRMMRTPPAWDGSLEALEQFNNRPKE